MDVYLSDVRDQKAAEAFFKQAIDTTGIVPEKIMTDKEPALYPAIRSVFGDKTLHRDSKYMNNKIEQNHRGIKSRYKVMKGFKHPISALIFCTAFEEIRQLFRAKEKTRSQRRCFLAPKIQKFHQLLTVTV